jgi:CRISPR-associated protein Csm5
MGNLKQQAKGADDKLFMERLFTDFALSYQDQPVSSKQGPNTDIMRAVHITDSEPLLKQEVLNKKRQSVLRNLPVVVEVIVSSYFPDGKGKYKAPIFTEMVWNVNTQFTISLDSTMLSWFHHTQGMQIPFKTVDDILKICNEFAQDQWDEEHVYWQEVSNNPHTKDNNRQSINLDFDAIREFYQPEKCPYGLRLGWASGMTGTTINLLLPGDLRQEIRDTCGLKAPGFEAPKSRRVVAISSREIKFVPGWAKFKVL